MPGSILSADTNFPNFSDQQSDSEKINVIQNYLYMLLEQLRYPGMGFPGPEIQDQAGRAEQRPDGSGTLLRYGRRD